MSPSIDRSPPAGPALDGARERCAELAARHYENFPVTGPLLPRAAREDLAAVYAFCRTTDDLGDEAPGDRLVPLDGWEAGLRQALAGRPSGDAVLTALAETIRRRDLPAEPFLRLIEANRRDQRGERYPDEAALLDYCSYSATPVGRMVLGVIGLDDPPRRALADATCVGLQLANFWQDLARDRERGRLYLPLEACARHGVDPEVELDRPAASPALRRLVAELVDGARGWLVQGWPLAARLPARWRPLVRGFSRGGFAICDAIARQGHDTLSARPVVSGARRRAIVLHELLRAPFRAVDPPGAARAEPS